MNGRKKVYFVEGLPAIGKSALARKLLAEEATNKIVCYYKEETCQPIDLFRQAILSPKQFNEFISLFPHLYPEIEKNSYRINDYYIIAYTMLSDPNAMLELHKYDLGDGQVPFSTYKQWHECVWNNFKKIALESETDTFIMEGAMLHNQLLDIIGFYDYDYNDLLNYYKKLVGHLSCFDTKLYFINCNNIERLVTSSLAERGTHPGSWGNGFHKWMESSSYCQKNRLEGEAGIIHVYRIFQKKAVSIINDLNMNVVWIDRII